MKSSFGFSEKQEKMIKETNGALADYGMGLNMIIPGFAQLVAPLNKLRLIALSPTLFEFKFLKILKLFVNFRE